MVRAAILLQGLLACAVLLASSASANAHDVFASNVGFVKKRASDKSEKPAHFGLHPKNCDDLLPKDYIGCCGRPREGDFSIMVTTDYKGKCFNPGDKIEVEWDILDGVGHTGDPTLLFAKKKVSPSVFTITAAVGYFDPNYDPTSAFTFGQNSTECMSRKKTTLIVQPNIDGTHWYPANRAVWNLYLYAAAQFNDKVHFELYTRIARPNPYDVADGFVISDAAGCKQYYEDIKRARGGGDGSAGSGCSDDGDDTGSGSCKDKGKGKDKHDHGKHSKDHDKGKGVH